MPHRYELEDVGNLTAEEYEALKVVLKQVTNLKNPDTDVIFGFDNSLKQFYTNNKTTQRLYNIMKDYIHEEREVDE